MGFSCPVAYGIFPDQGLNPCPIDGGFLTTEPPAKPSTSSLDLAFSLSFAQWIKRSLNSILSFWTEDPPLVSPWPLHPGLPAPCYHPAPSAPGSPGSLSFGRTGPLSSLAQDLCTCWCPSSSCHSLRPGSGARSQSSPSHTVQHGLSLFCRAQHSSSVGLSVPIFCLTSSSSIGCWATGAQRPCSELYFQHLASARRALFSE